MDDPENFLYHEKMIGFLIKKAFYDLWDNMFRIALLNLGFIASVAAATLLPSVIPVPALQLAVFIVGVLWCFVYLAATALSVRAISDYGTFGFADFWANIKQGWPAGLLMGAIYFLLITMAIFVIPFYLDLKTLAGILPAAVIFWTLVLSLISFQFFFAIRARLDTKPAKIIKKCFIIFFDNPGFSIFSVLYSIATLVVSAVPAFLIPGPAGILLFLDEGLRLRLLKYDWLEENPDPSAPRRRQIPWDAILIDEREKTGTRTFRNFIFPWKD
jgi:hypothetical protein